MSCEFIDKSFLVERELGQRKIGCHIVEFDGDTVADADLIDVFRDDIGQHAWTFMQRDHCDHVGSVRREHRACRLARDREGVDFALAARVDPFDIVGMTMRTKFARIEMVLAARPAARDRQAMLTCRTPEGLGARIDNRLGFLDRKSVV